jgi:hypothetical protein
MSMPGPFDPNQVPQGSSPGGPFVPNPYAAGGAPGYPEPYPGGPRPSVPGKCQAIAIMTLIGGILASIVGLVWLLYGLVGGLATFGVLCLMCLPAAYSITLGVLAIIKGAKLLGQNGYLEAPPKTIAIMQIVNVICCDFTNMVLGIITLVFLNDPYVRGYYRGV